MSKLLRCMFGRGPDSVEDLATNSTDIESGKATEQSTSHPQTQHDENGQPVKHEKTICHYTESPYWILKVAGQGNLEEVQRLVHEDEERLGIFDYRGQNVFHHSAAWGRLPVLEFLYEYNNSPHYNINLRDKLGNTPLHWAIEKGQVKSVNWLLKHNADLKVLNNNSSAPIHLAVDLNKIEIVKMIIEADHEMVNFPGDFGFTPLQYACTKDLAEIARYLLEEGADLFRDNDVGYSAIHAATRNGAAKVMDVLIEFASAQNISSEKLIHTIDKEKNLPLHSAVNSGDLRAVMVCLKAHADITAQHMEDKQTAVHYAAAKGSTDILRALFEAQPDRVETSLQSHDILEQTPLHKAAGFNHVETVELLLDSGASLNSQDEERRTPLILAASKGAVRVVNTLLKRRANVTLRDKDNRNFLHMAIMTGLKLKDIDVATIKNLKQLLNEKDDFGCCPIHYASKAGQLTTVKNLLGLGAVVTLKDNEKQSPLHFAAKYGKFQTAKNLLNSEQGALLINEVDGDGRTPLLIAAMYGHYKVIALLVRKGAQMSKDFQQNTALHMAAEYGNHEAVVLLVGLAPHLLNACNKQGNTALHLAAQNGHALIVDYLMTAEAKFEYNADGATFFDLAIVKFQPDAAAAVIRHSRCEEAMQLRSSLGSPMIGLIQHLPKICILFLDKCINYAATNKKSPEFYVQYDFRYLKTPDYMVEETKDEVEKVMPLLPLNMMVKHNRVDCLAHPLCVTFLQKKWTSYGAQIYNLRIGLYIAFLALLTSVAYDVGEIVGLLKCTTCHGNGTFSDVWQDSRMLNNNDSRINSSFYDKNETFLSSASSFSKEKQSESDMIAGGLLIRMVLVALFCLVNMGFQFFSIFQQKLAYFVDFTHYIELTLYISTFCMTIPSIANRVDYDLQFICSVISMFLGWINLLLYTQRFDFFGLYVVMFVEIFKTVIRVFIVFSFLIVAFALTLTVVFRTTDGPTIIFNDPLVSIIATLSMMLGEMNYVALISPTVNGQRQLLYPTLSYIVYVGFIVLIPILLTNLLVGLAVGNIESVQKNARLKRLAMQVEFFTTLERRMPQAFLKRRLLDEWKFFPNKARKTIFQKLKTSTKSGSRGGVGDDVEGDENKTDFAYLLEELTLQSRHLTGLGSKFDNQQDVLKLIVTKMDAELFNNGQVNDPDRESGGEEDDTIDRSQASATEFRSPAARAQWHAVTTRFAAFKKVKTNQLALVDEDDNDSNDRANTARRRVFGGNRQASIDKS